MKCIVQQRWNKVIQNLYTCTSIDTRENVNKCFIIIELQNATWKFNLMRWLQEKVFIATKAMKTFVYTGLLCSNDNSFEDCNNLNNIFSRKKV